MDHYEQKEASGCKVKEVSRPECRIYPNTFPFTGKEELNGWLPYPLVEWSDHYQTVTNSARKIEADFRYVKKLKCLHEQKLRRRLSHDVD